MKLNAIIKLVFLGLILSACTDDGQDLIPVVVRSNPSSQAAETGPISFLNLAKFSLLEMVNNSSDEIYKNFPEDKNKEWLKEVIRTVDLKSTVLATDKKISAAQAKDTTVELKTPEAQPLKLTHDSALGRVYVTDIFIQTMTNEKPWASSAKVKLDAVYTLQLEILSEIARLYGVGDTESTKDQATQWAINLLINRIGTEKIVCLEKQDANSTDVTPSKAVVFNPTGFSFFGEINETSEVEALKNPSVRLILTSGLQPEANEDDFNMQYFVLINLALKHTKAPQIKDVLPQSRSSRSRVEEMASRTGSETTDTSSAQADVITPNVVLELSTEWPAISEVSLYSLGQVSEADANRLKFTVFNDLTPSAAKASSAEKISYAFDYDKKTQEALISVTTETQHDTLASQINKTSAVESDKQSLHLECEHSVQAMSF